MTLPTTPFVCTGINLEAAAEHLYDNFIAWLPDDNRWKHSTNEEAKAKAKNHARRIIAAALGETITPEVETRAWCEVHDAQSWDGRDLFCLLHPGDPEERSCRMKRVLVIPFELTDIATEGQSASGEAALAALEGREP